jgi:hypothetical protein
MAENKKSFVLYSDSKSIIDLLTNEQAGLLLKTLFAYVNDENPKIENSIALVFEMIKLQLKRDLKKWEQTKEGRSAAGKASAEAKRLAKLKEQNSTNSTNVDFVQQTSTNSTVSVSVNDSVSVSVNEINNKKEKTPTVNWEGLLNQFNEITGKKAKVIDDKTKKQFLARLKEGYTKIDIVNAITNCYNSEFHKSNGHKNLTLEFISRPDKFAMYFDFKETIVKPQIKNDRL